MSDRHRSFLRCPAYRESIASIQTKIEVRATERVNTIRLGCQGVRSLFLPPSMPTIPCPHCGREFQYPDLFAGGSVACPRAGCAKAVQLPNLDGTFPRQYTGPAPPPLPTGPRRSEEYYVRKQFDSSVVVGPLPRARIRDLVLERKIQAEDELSADKKKWSVAIRVEPEFFGRCAEQSLCKTCAAAVSPGVTTCAACAALGAEASESESSRTYRVGAAVCANVRTLSAAEGIADFASARSADAIVAASNNGWLGLYCAANNKPLRIWQFDGADDVRVAVADKGRVAIVAARTRRRTRIYLANFERRQLADIADLDGTIREFALDPDGKYLAFVDNHSDFRLYRVNPWKRIDQYPVRGERFAFCLARDRMAAAAEDGRLFIWDLRAGKIVCELEGNRNEPACPTTPVGLSFSDTGAHVFAGTGYLVNLPRGVLFRGPTDAQAFAVGFFNPVIGGAVGGALAMAAVNNAEWIAKDMQKQKWEATCQELQRVTRLRSWEVKSGRMTADLADILTIHQAGIGAAYFAPKGDEVITVGPTNAHVWGLSTAGSRGPIFDEGDSGVANASNSDPLHPRVRRVDFTHKGDEAVILVAGAKGLRIAPLPRVSQ